MRGCNEFRQRLGFRGVTSIAARQAIHCRYSKCIPYRPAQHGAQTEKNGVVRSEWRR